MSAPEPPRPRGPLPVLIAVGAIILVVVILLSLGKSEPTRPAEPVGAAIPTPQMITREGFRNRCHPPMTGEQCKSMVGSPDRTQRIGGEDTWYYRGATIDPQTGKVDAFVQVLFNEDGKVRGLNFY